MTEQRAVALRGKLAELELDAFLTGHLVHVRYLTGFSGSNGATAVTSDESLLATDSRYTLQAGEQSPHARLIIERDGLMACLRDLARHNCARIGIEPEHLTAGQLRLLQAAATELGVAVVDTGGLIEELRLLKDDAELAAVERACAITAEAWRQLLEEGVAGRTESDVAGRLEHLFRQLGAEDRAFETIVAAGPNSAIPHHHPTDRLIRAGDLLKIDCGAKVDGYHADMTRTVAVGSVAGWQAEIHAAVREVQADTMRLIRPGMDPFEVDAYAHREIASRGYGDYFVHQTGHGVGLDIHERPFLGRRDAILAPRMPVTVEPGIYLPGRGGVRIEDTLLVTDDGHRILTDAERGLLVV